MIYEIRAWVFQPKSKTQRELWILFFIFPAPTLARVNVKAWKMRKIIPNKRIMIAECEVSPHSLATISNSDFTMKRNHDLGCSSVVVGCRAAAVGEKSESVEKFCGKGWGRCGWMSGRVGTAELRTTQRQKEEIGAKHKHNKQRLIFTWITIIQFVVERDEGERKGDEERWAMEKMNGKRMKDEFEWTEWESEFLCK